MTNPNYYAAMMLQFGQVDALVGGVNSYSGALLRPLIQLVKLLPHSPFVSGCLVAEVPDKKYGDDGVLFLADCGVVPDPDVEQLASIAVQTGLVARQVFGTRPRIAMLSFSTKGSAKTPSTEKVARAVAIVRDLADQLGVEIAVDGEMQADAALVPEVAHRKMGPSTVGGKANVLIFPDLNSGNIAAKFVQYLAGARVFGQILLGLSRPAADLSRGAGVDDIVAVAALVGLQAVEYRKLYPSEVVEPDIA
jgi:phosphate acetyltransferase